MTRHTRALPRITADSAERDGDHLFRMPEADLPDDLGKAKPMTTNTNPVEQPAPRAYAAKLYTIDAVSPLGFPVHLTFADLKLTELAEHIASLAKLGYTPPTQAPATAAPLATPDDLPEGWKLCQKHGAPMRPRNKQNQNWHSHNVGTKDEPLWCKGYRGADSPGYEVE